MEQRVYFVFGDIINCLGCGALGGYWATSVIRPEWHDIPSMATGMLLGMAAALLAGLLFTPLFGAMEIMLPGMLAGMLGGMLGAMTPITSGTDSWCGAALTRVGMEHWTGWETGMAAGILTLIFTYLLQIRYEGKTA